ncbi:hypothetical protein [Spirosoma spitsbergense]|nr:hypothetical protein [Spirosoma spitsbergense]
MFPSSPPIGRHRFLVGMVLAGILLVSLNSPLLARTVAKAPAGLY